MFYLMKIDLIIYISRLEWFIIGLWGFLDMSLMFKECFDGWIKCIMKMVECFIIYFIIIWNMVKLEFMI